MPKKLLPYLFVPVLVLCVQVPEVFAALQNPLGANASIPMLIGRLIRAALGLSGAVALLMFVYGGFMWLISAGDAKKVQKGKDTFTYAVIGLVIIFTAYTAVNFIIDALQGRV